MPTVGIIGNDADDTTEVFVRMCRAVGCCADKVDATQAEDAFAGDFQRIQVGGCDTGVRVLVAQSPSPALAIVKQLTSEDYVIANADRTELFPLLVNCAARLITFGFNTKACVTASSVTDARLQVCVQRGFPSIGGHAVEPGEFAAPCPGNASAAAVLGAVTACAVCDIACACSKDLQV